MYKIILRSIILVIILIVSFIIYFSTLGIKTSKFNQLIIDKLSKFEPRLKVQIEDVYLKLNLEKREIKLNTSNTNLYLENNIIKLSNVKLNLDLFSLFSKKQILKNLELETKENSIKNITNFVNSYKFNLPLFLIYLIVLNI